MGVGRASKGAAAWLRNEWCVQHAGEAPAGDGAVHTRCVAPFLAPPSPANSVRGSQEGAGRGILLAEEVVSANQSMKPFLRLPMVNQRW